MNKELAEKTALVVSQSSFILDSFLYELKESLEPEEFQEYCKKFGKVMGEAYFRFWLRYGNNIQSFCQRKWAAHTKQRMNTMKAFISLLGANPEGLAPNKSFKVDASALP